MKHLSLLIFSLLIITGCASTITPKEPLARFPVSIGVLADSQKTTNKETYQSFSFRSPEADKVSSVSLRPPGLEYLSISLLKYFLNSLGEEKVDLILYLGDAANSGCKDELDAVFAELENAREKFEIPTYFLIGNHDYLGTGNQTLRSVKKKLCGRKEDDFNNKYVDKDELIDRIVTHNKASAEKDKNFSYIGKVRKFSESANEGDCDESHNFLYYAAALKPKDTSSHSVDILLADTSDYKNVWFRPVLKLFGRCEILGGAGLKGSMSKEQIHDLEDLGCNAEVPCNYKEILKQGKNPQNGLDYRIVASHYDPASFNALYPWNWSPSFVKDNLGYLLSNGENIWLGAHHHSEKPLTQSYPVGKSLFPGPNGYFSGFSVGSTTDYYPHAAVVEAKTWFNGKITDHVGYRTIKAPDVNDICHSVFEFIEKHESEYSPVVCGNNTYADIKSMFGINKIYEKPGCWQQITYETIHKNIDALVKAAENNLLSTDEENAKLCLAVFASHEEHEVEIDR